MSAEISVNRKALRDFHITDRFEAGVELKGTEVKSIRGGLANLSNAYARVENAQVYLYDADIQPYARASFEQHEPKRKRRLLLHKAEIDKLFGATSVKGLTLIALRMYWKKDRVKVELGLGKGKLAHDKRGDLKERQTDRETAREISQFNRKHG